MYKTLIRTISRKKYLKGNFKYTANTFSEYFSFFQGCTCLTSRLTFSCCHSYWKSFYIDDQYEVSLTCLIHPIGIK